MKKTSFIPIALFMLLLSAAYCATAQPEDKRGLRIYAELGAGKGSARTLNFGLNTLFAQNNIISLGCDYSWHPAPNQPPDFVDKNGYNADQTLTMFHLMYGKVIYTNSHLVRFVLKGGLSAGQVSTPEDYKLVQTVNFWSFIGALFGGQSTYRDVYEYTMRDQHVVGMVLNPQLEFPLTRGFGFSVGLYANINSVASIYSVVGNITFGKVRNRRSADW